ncbi:hypothetical protein AGIG_G18253 [Arapaima gigas]
MEPHLGHNGMKEKRTASAVGCRNRRGAAEVPAANRQQTHLRSSDRANALNRSPPTPAVLLVAAAAAKNPQKCHATLDHLSARTSPVRRSQHHTRCLPPAVPRRPGFR